MLILWKVLMKNWSKLKHWFEQSLLNITQPLKLVEWYLDAPGIFNFFLRIVAIL